MTIARSQNRENQVYAEKRALYLYEQACKKNFLRQFVSMLKQEQNDLMDLQAVLGDTMLLQQHENVNETVALSQIQGSANNGRTHDFDSQFRPKNQHTKSRWVGLATARSLGKRIPPVQLTTVVGVPGFENIYFVEDGHHRISLANAMGEDHIIANVTVVRVAGGRA